MKDKEEEEEENESTKITGFLEALDLVLDDFLSGYITEQEMLEMIIMISSIRNISTPTIDRIIQLFNDGKETEINNVLALAFVEWIRKDVLVQQQNEKK